MEPHEDIIDSVYLARSTDGMKSKSTLKSLLNSLTTAAALFPPPSLTIIDIMQFSRMRKLHSLFLSLSSQLTTAEMFQSDY